MRRLHPPELHPLRPQSPPSLGSTLPPLSPLHHCPRSVPPSLRPRKTGAPGWSGNARSTPIAIRAIQSQPSSHHWTSARQPRPPAPPPLLPPLPYACLPPLPSFLLLPFCRRPLMGRCGNFANRRHRGDRPPLFKDLSLVTLNHSPLLPHWLRMVAPTYRLYRWGPMYPLSIVYLLRTLRDKCQLPPPPRPRPPPLLLAKILV